MRACCAASWKVATLRRVAEGPAAEPITLAVVREARTTGLGSVTSGVTAGPDYETDAAVAKSLPAAGCPWAIRSPGEEEAAQIHRRNFGRDEGLQPPQDT